MKQIIKLLTLATQFFVFFYLSPLPIYAQSGFQYLGSYDSNGVPTYLEEQPDAIDTAMKADILRALPEQKPVPQFHPHYIAGQVQTELRLKQEADVWVTFVGEGAGWKNALGFYSYQPANAPQKKEDISFKTIIFPNVSALSSGGALQAGSKVNIGHFKANTVIGWFVVADGWRNNKVSGGNYLLFSNPDFNPESTPADRSHMVLLHDEKRNKLILGFEDTRRDQGSDHDFNDILFYVSADPFTAIEKENIVVLNSPPPAANQTDSTTHTPVSPTNSTTHTTNNTTHNTTTNTANNNTATTSNSNNINTTNTNNSNHATNSSSTNNSTSNSANTTTTSNSHNTANNANNTTSHSNNTTHTSNANNTTNSNNTTTVINNNTTVINQNSQTGTQNRGGSNRNPSRNRPDANSPTHSGNSNQNGYPSQNTSASSCRTYGFTQQDFTKTYTLIVNKPNEDVRVSTIKQAVRGRLLNVDQCIRLLSTLKVSSHQLSMAKYLFDYSCEQNNYFMVSKVFTVAAHEREFNAFLASKNLDRPLPRQSNQNIASTRPSDEADFTDDELEVLVNSVSRQSFSDTRMSLIQQALQNRYITSKQAIDLLKVMSFETDKLKLAKFLYAYTSDKQNYYKLHTAFSFSSSVDELNAYLKDK